MAKRSMLAQLIYDLASVVVRPILYREFSKVADDPDFKDKLKMAREAIDDIEEKMKKYCKEHPESELCKKRRSNN
jgi:hypothetical protein